MDQILFFTDFEHHLGRTQFDYYFPATHGFPYFVYAEVEVEGQQCSHI